MTEALKKNAFALLGVLFMLVALVRSVQGDDSIAVWIALGAVFIALNASQHAKRKDGDDAR
ncbi:MAG: hypothetical protein INF91_02935 [Alphaproteobacteria bacterium]|nr:hypothetical protein [Alphaproteobacteria bacterium]